MTHLYTVSGMFVGPIAPGLIAAAMALANGSFPRRHDLMHDVEVVGRGGATAVIGIVLAAFVTLAVGATVYDIGKWLGAW